MLSDLCRQYHACWCTGDFRSQCITRHGIEPQYSVSSISRVNYASSHYYYGVIYAFVYLWINNNGGCDMDMLHSKHYLGRWNMTSYTMSWYDTMNQVNSNACMIVNIYDEPCHVTKADSRLAPSQWEMTLLCNDISHWLGTNIESTL